MKKFFLVLLLNSVFYLALTQVYIPSPQTYDFVRYGNIPINHYTGELDLSVPIYNSSDKDFNISVALGYNSSGFQPNKHSSTVGLNWFLKTGGVITRTINGVPDDAIKYQELINGATLTGFWKLAQLKAYSNSQLRDLSVVSSYFFTPRIMHKSIPYETEPDEFYFHVMGLSGKFMIDVSGKIHVICDHAVKVNLSGMTGQAYSTYHSHKSIQNSEITLTDDRGYQYVFGGNHNYLEYSFSLPGGREERNPKIISWYLKRITAPNKRIATFEYQDFKLPTFNQIKDQVHYQLNITKNYSVTAEMNSKHMDILQDGASYTATKLTYLKRVAFGNTEILFKYAPKARKFYDSKEFGYTPKASIMNEANLQLEEVAVKAGNQLVTQMDFKYQYLGRSHKRMFLTELVRQDGAKYTLQYATNYSFPYPSTVGIDHWGYWNGVNDLYPASSLLPEYWMDSNNDVTYHGSLRKVDSHSCKAGLLTKIIYPTGGYSEFSYEGHQYSKRVERRSDNRFIPKVYTVNGAAGGVRIRSITDYATSGSSKQRTFKYVQAYTNESKAIFTSSGLLNQWPRYAICWKTEATSNSGWSGLTYFRIRIPAKSLIHLNSSDLNAYNYSENHITYSEVTEVVNGNGYITHHYSNFSSNPDVNELSFNPDNKYNMNYFHTYMKMNDRSVERGKLLKQIYYNKDNKRVRMTDYEYNTNPSRYSESFIGVWLCRLLPQPYRIYSFSNKLSSRRITEYVNNTPAMVSSSVFTYNANKNIHKKTEYNSEGASLVTTYKYPANLACENNVYKQMKDAFMLNYPIEIIREKGGKTIGVSVTTYDQFSGSIQPASKDKLETLTALSDYQPLGVSYTSCTLVKDRRLKPEVFFDAYDISGNLLQYHTPGQEPTSYLWGYNKQYPVARFENMSHSDINSKSSLKNRLDQLDDYTKLYKPDDRKQLKMLNHDIRNKLPDACRITTYTYDPLIGMTSQTDPNGISTYYEYDKLNRLLAVRDNSGSLLKSYNYKYHNQTNLFLTVSPKGLSFQHNTALSKTITVSSNVSWLVSHNANWISVSKSKGNGNDTFVITCTPNKGSKSRSTIVTVKGSGITKTIPIVQFSPPVLSLSTYSAFCNKYGTPQIKVDVTCNSIWTVSPQENWIKVSKTTGRGNGSFYVHPDYNASGKLRRGSINLTSNGQTVSFTVVQGALDSGLKRLDLNRKSSGRKAGVLLPAQE